MRYPMMVAALAASMLPAPARAQSTPEVRLAAPTDTAIPDRRLFHRSDAIVAGAFVLGTVALIPFDEKLADTFRDEQEKGNRSLDNLVSTVRFFGGAGPVIIGSSMYVVGRLGHIPRLAELGLHGTEALFVGSTVASAIKIVAGRARPFVSVDTNPRDFALGRGRQNKYMSFPSGHSTAAFSVAAAVVAETHEWWPRSTWYVAPLMFGGATAVGLSRMYDDQHWASDVLMGAAIGTFAGLKTVRFNHTHTGNRLDAILLGARVAPTANGAALAWGGSF